MQLVLDSNGLTVKKRNNNFWIIHKKGKRLISPFKVSSIAVTADCYLSTAAIRLAVSHGIPIYFINKYGKTDAQLWSANFEKKTEIRRKQVIFSETVEATRYILILFELKTNGQIKNVDHWCSRQVSEINRAAESKKILLDYFKKAKKLASDQKLDSVRDQLMGLEGTAAKTYWQFLSSTLPKEWHFTTRNRRPAIDPFNAILNYSYGLLYPVVESALFAAGLDPYLGMLHADQYQRPTLVYDMIEPFRP